ncbi:MAG: hypothetical protein FJ191_00760 [Gammaproteobacteria bacterium]|nr:hypothetical protein [Gammaproteobacteria bacterium]
MSNIEPEAVGTATPGIADPPLPFTGGRIPASAREYRLAQWRVMALCFVAPALAFVAISLGVSLGWPWLAALGALGLGLTGVTLGLLAARERRLFFMRQTGPLGRRQYRYRYFIYEGFAAVPYGLAYAIAGAMLALAALLFLVGVSPDRMRMAVLARPHYALLPGGAALFAWGLGFLIGFGRPARSAGDRLAIGLQHLPARLGGLILLAWAVAMLGIGLVEATTPALFHAWFQSLTGNPWPFGRG